MELFLLQSDKMFTFSIGLLIVMMAVLLLFIGILIAKLNKLKDYIPKHKNDILVTIISIVVLAMCIGGIFTFIFCISPLVK